MAKLFENFQFDEVPLVYFSSIPWNNYRLCYKIDKSLKDLFMNSKLSEFKKYLNLFNQELKR